MSENDIYQQLFDMYAQWPFGAHKVVDSFMELLRCQFTPEEAELAIKIGFNNIKFGEVQRRTGMESSRLRQMLNTMADKGTLWVTPGVEEPDYRTIGVAGPGLVETGGWGNIRFPHSVRLMQALHRFEVDFAVKCLPDLKYPVYVWTTPEALPADADPKDNVAERIKEAGSWGISTCSCRLPHWISDPGDHCRHLLETCLFMGETARWGAEHGICREITYEEAVATLKRCNEDGLVHTYDPLDFICNCCTDCCVFFVCLNKTGYNPLRPAPYVAAIDQSTCNACGVCVQRCPFGAIVMEGFAVVDTEKCMGCGVCFPTCDMGAVEMVKRAK